MNLTTAVMLVEESIRPLKVLYDPENPSKSYNPMQLFKTLDQSIKKDDLVVVQTNTRHGYTVAKVVECDFPVNHQSNDQWGWAVKFDHKSFETVLETERKIVHRVGKAQENKMKAELKAAMGLEDVSFADLRLVEGPDEKPQEAAPVE